MIMLAGKSFEPRWFMAIGIFMVLALAALVPLFVRTRQWAVEWDESAIEFLLQKGFTADLGARPLKRAVERYVLSPLAMTIVNHQFPEGDQFLFVRSAPDGESIDVQFVAPDAPVEGAEQEAAALRREGVARR